MSSKTKIIVLHMKEVVYTAIFLLFMVILGIILFFMFGPGKSLVTGSEDIDRYTPGIYRTSVNLNNNNFDVEVTVDSNRIQSISSNDIFPITPHNHVHFGGFCGAGFGINTKDVRTFNVL